MRWFLVASSWPDGLWSHGYRQAPTIEDLGLGPNEQATEVPGAAVPEYCPRAFDWLLNLSTHSRGDGLKLSPDP